jgi:hypothetical protein
MTGALGLVKDYMFEDCWDWRGPEYGNEGQMTIRWAHQNVDKWLRDLNPEVALMMFGTNDLGSLELQEYETKTREVVQKCLDNNTILILSTIPPKHGQAEKAAAFADAVRKIAREMKVPLTEMDRSRVVRCRVYRYAKPITAASLSQAELLAEVPPMSGYNVLGRSVDQLIAQHRRRAVDDMEFAKQLARNDYFAKYHPDMPEMDEVRIPRFAIEDGRPLGPRLGLYVHHPDRAGKAYYAVVPAVDGAADARDVSGAGPVDEVVGPGEPVLQGKPEVTVFFDYPGERRHYVHWAAPPLANLPNQYYNGGLFLPRGYAQASVKRLSVFFHDAGQR